MPLVEVDADVYEYVRARVRDFNESFGSVLRRELGMSKGESRPGRAPSAPQAPSIPATDISSPTLLGAPEALRQILQVVSLVRRASMDRVTATIQVARQLGVTRETVADKYGRQLELTTHQFDSLLGEASLEGLRSRLIVKFPQHRAHISAHLSELARKP